MKITMNRRAAYNAGVRSVRIALECFLDDLH
jgi:hypothetical protein